MASEPAPEEDQEEVHRIPGLPHDLMEVYEGLIAAGATSPSEGRAVDAVSKAVHHPKKQTLHELHQLEGKGIVRHRGDGKEAWYYACK